MRFGTIGAAVLACTLIITTAPQAGAQGQLGAAITVDDRVVTQYEINQRKLLLGVFNTIGNIDQIARDELIEERLKQQEMARFDRSLSPGALQAELEAFAARGNLSLPEFVQVLNGNGVDVRSFVTYVSVGALWRDFIRARYSREVTVTEADIDRVLSGQGAAGTQLEVLLSEIIIPAPPEREARVREVAGQISQLRSFSEFENAARQVSALPSRENGGRLDWRPIGSYPPPIQALLLDLSTGEVTEPIDIPNAVALFQKRGQREARRTSQAPVSIEYATYFIEGGQTAAARNRAAEIARQVDTCDDLYGIARNQPPEVLERVTSAPADIPTDVALELARLDPGEISANLTTSDGEQLAFVMLCTRNRAGAGTSDREIIRNQIRSQRLAALAGALIADLQASAVISR